MGDVNENSEPKSSFDDSKEAALGLLQGIWQNQTDVSFPVRVAMDPDKEFQNDLEILSQTGAKAWENLMDRPVKTSVEFVICPAIPGFHALGNVLYDRNEKQGA